MQALKQVIEHNSNDKNDGKVRLELVYPMLDPATGVLPAGEEPELRCRSLQGHAGRVMGQCDPNLVTGRVLLPAEVPWILIHGSKLPHGRSIATTGLTTGGERRDRAQIYFVENPTRNRAAGQYGIHDHHNMIVYVEARVAAAAGVPFRFCATTGVHLSEGIDGVIPPKYIAKLENRQSREALHTDLVPDMWEVRRLDREGAPVMEFDMGGLCFRT